MLALKLFRDTPCDASTLVTWQMFNKDLKGGRNYTFWEWFFGSSV